MEVCGAQTRQGHTCKNAAGKGTDHQGSGRCSFHGGATPIRHGRYSTIQRPRLQERLRELQEDTDPLDLVPEAQMIRALTMDFIERYDELTDALLEWNYDEAGDARSENRRPRPQRVPEIHEAADLLDKVSRVVERAQKARKEGAITMDTFNRVMEQMGVSVARHVKDPAALQAIETEWLAIQLA